MTFRTSHIIALATSSPAVGFVGDLVGQTGQNGRESDQFASLQETKGLHEKLCIA
jgi:hypothetical protein